MFTKAEFPIQTISFLFVTPNKEDQMDLKISKPRDDMGTFWDGKTELSELLEVEVRQRRSIGPNKSSIISTA